jgi:hypothetical protein
MLNYAFVTTRQPGELLIVKNRHGTQGGAMDVLREALMVRGVESAGDDRVKINISDDDRVMLRLRGLHI